ncbi:MAG: TIGR00341 family protein [Bacteroidales bacterium]|nr:TIGR00341 family protein [Bacteroidales bacterium]
MILDTLKQQLKQYFNLAPYLEDEGQAKQSILDGVSFRGPNILILIFAIFVASLGLNTNSPAVIIGAMLISPLMGPIIGIGLGVGTYDFPLIQRSARNLAAAALFSVLAATLYFLISPVSEGRSELLARTSPTIYDVLIAFFGGAAGIVAIACKQKGNVIPGVAIATALMPPLCTAGYGLATLQLNFFFGAFYLFLINSIFIALSTLIGVRLFKFHAVTFVNPDRKKKVKRWVYALVIITLAPSLFLTVQMLRESFFVNDANTFIEDNFNLPNTQVFSKDAYVKHWKKYIEVTLIGQAVNVDSLKLALTAKLDQKAILRGTNLTIKQGFSTTVENANPAQGMGDLFNTVMAQIDRQKASIDSLQRIIVARENFDSLSYAIAPEIRVLYPHITHIALSRMLMCNTDTRRIDTINVALIEHTRPLTKDVHTIERYIETRTGLKNIHIMDTSIDKK